MSQILLLLAPAKRRLTDASLERLSSIFADVAQISLASVVIPALLDKSNPVLVTWGLIITMMCWFISIAIAQQIK